MWLPIQLAQVQAHPAECQGELSQQCLHVLCNATDPGKRLNCMCKVADISCSTVSLSPCDACTQEHKPAANFRVPQQQRMPLERPVQQGQLQSPMLTGL